MGKISKEMMKRHSKAMEIIEQDVLSYDDKLYVLENYHEGATNMNNLVSAHFTPMSLARSVEQCTRNYNFVDLCAGIGILAWCQVRIMEFEQKEFTGICVENCLEYCKIGKKLMPELHWINGDIFNPKVIARIKEIMGDRDFSVISNPPYGRQVKTFTDILQYKGPEFEYKAVELGFQLGASEGVFLIPQASCNFNMSSQRETRLNLPCKKYEKFYKETAIEMSPNIGFTTDILEGPTWKDVSIATEIAIFEYGEIREQMEEEHQAEVEASVEEEDNEQLGLF